MDALLYYGTFHAGIEYIGARNGKGPISEQLRALPMTGQDLRELNLLAYVLDRFERTAPDQMLGLENQLEKDKSASLKELINTAYKLDGFSEQYYTGDNLDSLLQYERGAYGLCLNTVPPHPEPWRRIGEMEEGKPYWMTGIDQFCEYQVFIRQTDGLLQCPAWRNDDESIRFSEDIDTSILYTKTDLPSLDTTFKAAADILLARYNASMDGNLPEGILYETVESALLPGEIAQKGCEIQQMGSM